MNADDCRTSAMSCSFRNLAQEAQAMDRLASWNEDIERLAEEPLPRTPRSGAARPGANFPLHGGHILLWSEEPQQPVRLEKDPDARCRLRRSMLHDDAINSCIEIELNPTPQQRELLKKMFGRSGMKS
ncbi:hypothetical protein PRIC1_002693 [Phytophthora ramorum]